MWPAWPHLRYFALLSLAQTFWFGFIYGGADLITAHGARRLRVHLEFEEMLPFVPAMVWIYMSIYLLFAVAPFILHSRRELRALVITFALVTLCAGVCFLLFPAELDFPIPPDLGTSVALFHLADRLNLDYNQVPSLHVALSVVCAAVFASYAGAKMRIFLWLWALAIGASAVLTYQHHLLDVLAGLLLGWVAERLVYQRLRTSDLWA